MLKADSWFCYLGVHEPIAILDKLKIYSECKDSAIYHSITSSNIFIMDKLA